MLVFFHCLHFDPCLSFWTYNLGFGLKKLASCSVSCLSLCFAFASVLYKGYFSLWTSSQCHRWISSTLMLVVTCQQIYTNKKCTHTFGCNYSFNVNELAPWCSHGQTQRPAYCTSSQGPIALYRVCVFSLFFIAYLPPSRSHHVQALTHNLRLLQCVRIALRYVCVCVCVCVRGTSCIHRDHLFTLPVLSSNKKTW